MGRYIAASCRQCRRERNKLFLKGSKCLSAKCVLERRNFEPGMSGAVSAQTKGGRKKTSEYGVQLREKQKARRIYGILERQFHKTFLAAVRGKGVTGENLVRLLERRLDNVVYRLGFAASRKAARQLVRHGHVKINNRKVSIPSALVRVGDRIALKSTDLDSVKAAVEAARKRQQAGWLEVDHDQRTGRVVALPSRDALEIPLQEKLIVELYSK